MRRAHKHNDALAGQPGFSRALASRAGAHGMCSKAARTMLHMLASQTSCGRLHLGCDKELLAGANALLQRAFDAGAHLLQPACEPLSSCNAASAQSDLLVSVIASAVNVPPADFYRLVHDVAHHTGACFPSAQPDNRHVSSSRQGDVFHRRW